MWHKQRPIVDLQPAPDRKVNQLQTSGLSRQTAREFTTTISALIRRHSHISELHLPLPTYLPVKPVPVSSLSGSG